MKLFQTFRDNQDRRPGPKPYYYRPANIETLRLPQSLLAQSIR